MMRISVFFAFQMPLCIDTIKGRFTHMALFDFVQDRWVEAELEIVFVTGKF
jgi:hypothetical protein